MTREDLLRAIVEDAYELARREVYDVAGWSPDMRLSRLQVTVLAHLQDAESELAAYRASPVRLRELVCA